MQLSIVIPTYGREVVLLDTIRSLLALQEPADEILIIDQTPQHEPTTQQQLQAWHEAGQIRWLRREVPGIPQAMNAGLLAAHNELVLFLDDDIIPAPQLVAAHQRAHAEHNVWAVVGQVLQPWQQPAAVSAPRELQGLQIDFDFPFHSTLSASVQNVMAGNLSVDRARALSVGGFDEQFTGSAYRIETDFARRIGATGGSIWFCGDASIKHLRVPSGGTRQKGDHRSSSDPKHGVGDYYFALRHGQRAVAFRYMSHRLIREVCTKFHLCYPWYIPVKLLGEIRAWWWAKQLSRSGPRLITNPAEKPTEPNRGPQL